MREFRADLGRLRGNLGELTGLLEQLKGNWRSTTAFVSELLPRVDVIEAELGALTARLDAQEGEGDGGPDGPSWTPTPAVGWEDMDQAAAAAAWEALARWVGETLAGSYRLTRLQLPDCWPLHPRAVRELAWLRTTHLAAGDKEARDQAQAGDTAEWHARWIGAAVENIAASIDPRECRPGIHRLTEGEVEAHQAQMALHQRGEAPAPVLTRETGPERPRLRPEHFPTRTAEPIRGQAGTATAAPTVRLLPLLLVETATSRFWIEHYREASRADIERREDLADVV